MVNKTIIDVNAGTTTTVALNPAELAEQTAMQVQHDADVAQGLIDDMLAEQKRRLVATDWTQGGDALNALLQADIDAYTQYRQDVRAINNDHPDGTDLGNAITWPVEPVV